VTRDVAERKLPAHVTPPKSPTPASNRRGKRASATDSGGPPAIGAAGKPPHSTSALRGSGVTIIRVAHNVRIVDQVSRKQACCEK